LASCCCSLLHWYLLMVCELLLTLTLTGMLYC